MRRKIYGQLLEWKARKHKCLVIKGQRQVGKTYIIDQFGRSEYRSYLYINLQFDTDIHPIFENPVSVDSIISRLELFHPEFEPLNGSTLIFLDEIQECPYARSALKLFTIDGRYDVIASGSFLGVEEARIGSYKSQSIPPLLPVGYEEHMILYSMDFEEFLWARGVSEENIEIIKDRLRRHVSVGSIEFDYYSREFRAFMVVGGMPEAVSAYVGGGYGDARKVLKDVLSTCMGDINRYNTGIDILKTQQCFNSIPFQLAESNKRFTYSRIEGGSSRNKAEKYAENLLWIRFSGYGNFCISLSQVALPLERNAVPDVFRVYLSDTGLLLSMMSNDVATAVFSNNLSYNRGAIVENEIAECLMKNGLQPYYYRKSNGDRKMELDFVTELDGRLTVIEVKSGKHREYPSLNKISGCRKIIFEDTDVFFDEKGEHYPLFAAAFLDCLRNGPL